MLWLLTDYPHELQWITYVIYNVCLIRKRHWFLSAGVETVLWTGEQITNHSLWSYRTDHCALLISQKLKWLSLSPYVFTLCLFIFVFVLSIPPFFFIPHLSSAAPDVRHPAARSPLPPPAGVWLLKPGGCWGSSQSCKWGSPPGWPRHSVVQVRKPATLPTEQRWERQGLCYNDCTPTLEGRRSVWLFWRQPQSMNILLLSFLRLQYTGQSSYYTVYEL